VAAAGAAVGEFKPGDEVFGVTGLRFGANAEYIAVRARSRIAMKPGNITFDEAAGVADGFLNASGCLRQAHLKGGETVLVYGASGSIGTAGVQLARQLGAHVTAVCQAKDFELVRSLGAAELIDYTIEDFTKNGRQYDVVFDAVGKLSFSRTRNSLKSGGWYLPTDGARNVVLAATTRQFSDKRVAMGMGSTSPKQDLRWLKQLVEAGDYRPVIDRIYPMDQVVEAARYVETRQKVGNVVLKVS
jgi:NADPH:quinone reductase-like Zn-dependent oxidoreductase